MRAQVAALLFLSFAAPLHPAKTMRAYGF